MPETLTTVQTSIAAWEAAEVALADGRTFTMGSRTLTRVDLPEVVARLTQLRRKEGQFLSYASSSRAPSAFSGGVAKIN